MIDIDPTKKAAIPIVRTMFEQLVQPHLPALRGYCTQLARNAADGDDLLQATLEKAYRAFRDLTIPLSKAYLFRIAQNAWIDGSRKRTIRAQPLAGDDPPDSRTSGIDIRDAFEVLAERLSVRQAVLLLMVDIFGFTAGEAARRTGSTEGAVKEALKRARLRLSRPGSEAGPGAGKRTDIAPGERITQELMETFIQAFRSGNIQRIYESYLRLRRGGLEVVKVWEKEEALYFDFTDPNGHLIRISAKLF
ncbi:RNA polymerase sigma factor [Paenibacillus humicola]|uniref:RNA polymerase sigma factor n=1 Tax=Paenibacillus humicola TaxID=3110540 RepID=UPI00237A1B10|nr:RNA polymerase sigma factor [Paenibacillus humicola]